MRLYTTTPQKATKPPDRYAAAVRIVTLRDHTVSAIANTLLAAPRQTVPMLDNAGILPHDLAHDDLRAVWRAARWYVDRPPTHWTPPGMIGEDAIDARRLAYARVVMSALELVGCVDPTTPACATGSRWSMQRVARRIHAAPMLADLPLLIGRLIHLRDADGRVAA